MKKRIRVCIGIMICGLALSGITAFPLETELAWLVTHTNFLSTWFYKVSEAISFINVRYPFLSYGTDWLAFAHLMLAILFIGPYRDPVKNKWVIEFGMIACAAIIPLAFIAGTVRQVPLYWQLIDCSFGVFGIIPLIICYYDIKKLNNECTFCKRRFYHTRDLG